MANKPNLNHLCSQPPSHVLLWHLNLPLPKPQPLLRKPQHDLYQRLNLLKAPLSRMQ